MDFDDEALLLEFSAIFAAQSQRIKWQRISINNSKNWKEMTEWKKVQRK